VFIHITLIVFNGVHASRKLDVINIVEEALSTFFWRKII